MTSVLQSLLLKAEIARELNTLCRHGIALQCNRYELHFTASSEGERKWGWLNGLVNPKCLWDWGECDTIIRAYRRHDSLRSGDGVFERLPIADPPAGSYFIEPSSWPFQRASDMPPNWKADNPWSDRLWKGLKRNTET